MPLAYINIGSNQGDRMANIDRAVAQIESALGATACRAPLYQSPAWGYDSALPYLNLGITVDTTMEAPKLMAVLLDIQQSINPASHRTADGTYADREIDIDLISLGDLTVDTPDLTLPHPRMHLRTFVLVPMATLLPTWRHPATSLTPAEMLHRL